MPNEEITPGERATSAGPLSGIRVVEFCQLVAGPGAGNALAALGADVVKVEPLGGEVSRTMGSYGIGIVQAHNRGKRSVTLDLRHPEARPVIDALVRRADVIIQNMRPGAMAALGLGADELRSQFPRLVYASVSGYPAGTAAYPRAGLDIAAQAEGGIMSVTGTADREPQRVGFPVVDEVTAGQLAQGIVVALFQRERTGVGAHVEISLLEAAIHLQSSLWGEFSASGAEPTRSGNGQVAVAPAADVLELDDGALVLSAYTATHWERLCETIGRRAMATDPRFVDNEARVANRGALRDALREALGEHTRASALALLQGAGLVAAPVNTYADVVVDPTVRDAGLLVEIGEVDGRRFQVPRLPYRLDGESLSRSSVPEPGDHNDQVLAELGFGEAELRDLVASGAVGGAGPALS